MQDPHVVSLTYKVKTNAYVTFNNPPAIEVETSEFKLKLDNGKATFKLITHFSTVASAREIIDNYIRAWEIDISLSMGRYAMELEYEDAKIKDRNPPLPGEPIVIYPSGTIHGLSSVGASLSVNLKSYPSPPKHFKINPDVETLWYRYNGYIQGKEPLQAMAYFCLTLLQYNVSDRKEATIYYKINRAVIDSLGDLTTDKGDKKTARKLDRNISPEPLTSKEVYWIESTIKAIIRRVGEMNSDKPLKEITMNDLPVL